jgi:hypothetical protein
MIIDAALICMHQVVWYNSSGGGGDGETAAG